MPVLAFADEGVVRAVLFYSPSCGHCHKVITQDLPPLIEKYGNRLQIIGVNSAEAGGGALFDATVERFNVASENRGVPLLVVGDTVLVGSLEIPEQFPGLIEQYLAAGGADWPDIPGLREAIAAAGTPEPAATAPIKADQKTPETGALAARGRAGKQCGDAHTGAGSRARWRRIRQH